MKNASKTTTNIRAFDSANGNNTSKGWIKRLCELAGLASEQKQEAFASLEGRQLLSAPGLTGMEANQPVLDSSTVFPFANVTVTDGDDDLLSVDVQLDNSARGVFTSGSLTTAGFTSEGGGRYTFFGLPGEATTALRALEFNPADNRVPVNFAEITRFTVTLDDSVNQTSDNSTTVRATSANDASEISGATTTTTINDTATTTPFSSMTIADVDPFQTLTVSVSLDTAGKGVFTSGSLTTSGFTAAGGGVYVVSGRAANVTTAIRALVFDPTNNRVSPSSTEVTTFTVAVNDGHGSVQDNSTTVTSTSVNDAPTITGAQAGVAVLDNATVQPFSAVTIGDVDSPAQSLDITVTIDDTAKGVFTTQSLIDSGFAAQGGGVYTFTGTAAAATVAIRALYFAPVENRVAVGSDETTNFEISVDDGEAAPVSNTTTTVVSSPFNDASTILGASANQAVNDNATITPFAGVTIDDADSPAQSLTLTVTVGNYAYGLFTSGSVNTAGMTFNGPNTYTITGTASDLTTAIQALVFAPEENTIAIGSTETATFTISVTDGITPAVENSTSSAVITPINDAAVMTGTSSGQATDDDDNITPFASVVISDADVPAQTFTLSIELDSNAKGEFTSASLTTTGFAFSSGVYSRTGTPAELQAAVRGLSYNPTDNRVSATNTETTTFTLTLADGLLADVTDSDTTVISTSVNFAPAISDALAGQEMFDNAQLTPFAAVTISDSDGDSLIVSVTLDSAAKGAFTAGSLTDSGFTDAGGGVYTFTGTASAATTAIRQLVFQPTENRAAVGNTETTTFDISVDDSIATAVTNNTTTVISEAYNDVHEVSGGVAGQTVNDNATVSPFTNFVIGDPDSPVQTMTLTVTIDDAAKGVFTSGSLTTAGMVHQGGGVYTRTGSANALETAIRALVFDPTENRVAVGSTETTTFTVSVDDGVIDPVTDSTTTVVSTSVNNAPSITGAVSSQAVNDHATLTPFSGVTIADADVESQLTVTVTLDTAAKGVFTSESLTSSGFEDEGSGVYTFTGSASDVTTAIRGLVYNPTDNRVSATNTETTTFTVEVSDTHTTTSDTDTTVVSTSVNFAPAISDAVTGQEVFDNATLTPFANVTLTDSDGDSLIVSVTLDSAAKGVFTSGSLTDSGFTDAGGGVYTFTGTAAAATTAIRQLVFQPTENRVTVGNTETTTFDISVDDSIATAVTDNDTTVISEAYNDVHGLSGAVADQAVNDNATVIPFANFVIGDPDSPVQIMTLTVTIDTAAKGVFTSGSLTTAGMVHQGGGVYTRTGSAADLETAIRALVFDPTENRVAVGSTETTTFTVSVDDGLIDPVVDSTTTVVSTSINNAPSISGAVGSQAVNDTATITPFSGVSFSDEDTATTLTITVTLDTAAKGVFTEDSLDESGFEFVSSGVYSFTGTPAEATTAIQGLVFDPTENRVVVGGTETTTFDVEVSDTHTSVNDTDSTVISTSINTAPTISGVDVGGAVNDNITVEPFFEVTIADADVGNQSQTVTVTITDTDKGSFTNDSLTASGFVNAGGGAYTFTGTATAATTAIRQLAFQPVANRIAIGQTEPASFVIDVEDAETATASNSDGVVVVTPVDDAAAIVNITNNTTINDTATSNPFSGVTINDADGDTNTVYAQVRWESAEQGTFSSESVDLAGFTFYDSHTLIGTGTPDQITQKLRDLVFVPAENRVTVGDTETTTFEIKVGTMGNEQDDQVNVVLNSLSINDAPVIGGTSSDQPVNDNATINPFASVTLVDGDAGEQLTVSVTISNTAHGTFSAQSLTETGFVNAGGGQFTLTASSSAAQAAIRGLVFVPVENDMLVGNNRSTTFVIDVTDAQNAAEADSSTTVVTTSVNTVPSISGTDADQEVNDIGELFPFWDVTIADGDLSESLTVTITLDSAAKGVLQTHFSGGSYNSETGVYTVSGTPSAVTDAVRNLVFAPTDNRVAVDALETTTFTIDVVDTYDASESNSGTTVLSLGINDAPTIEGTEAGLAVNDDATTTPFSGVTIGDADPEDVILVNIALDSAAKGSLSNLGEGSYNSETGVYTITGSASEVTTTVRGLVFTPAANRVTVGSTETTTFAVTVVDASDSSVENSTTTVVSTSINNAPVITGAEAGQGVNDNATLTPFTEVTIADVDPDQEILVQITLSNAANGTLSNLGGGEFSSEAGLYTITGSASEVTQAVRGLVFTPTANRVAVGSTETTTFAIIATDASDASAENTTATVVSTSINNAPTVTGLTTSQAVNDNATISPFAGVTVADVDPGQNVTIFVTQWSTATGVFTAGSLESSGFTDQGNGLYRFVGTASNATTALRALVFNPTDNVVSVGSTQQSNFSVNVYDATGAAAAGIASVLSTSINDAPTVAGTTSNGTVNDNASTQPFSSVTISDVDPGQTVLVYITQWNTAQGTFTPTSLTNSGFNTVSPGLIAFTGTASAATSALRALVYAPSANRLAVSASESNRFSVNVYDASGASAAAGAAVVASGINDVPVITGASLGISAADNASSTPFANLTISDVDPSDTITLFVSQWDTTAGSFTTGSLTNGGFTSAGSGVWRKVGSASAVTTAVRALVYNPAANTNAPGTSRTSTFSVNAYDASGGVDSDVVSVAALSINDAPGVSGTGNAGEVLDTSVTAPFANTSFTDVDAGASLTVTITVDDAAKGAFTAQSLQTSGFAALGNGVYTFTGTPAAATNAARALQFAPTLNRLNGNVTEQVGFSISLSDGIAPAVTDTGTTLTSVGVNNLPTVGSVTSSRTSIFTGQSFTLTANDVADSDGTVTGVQFWSDSNANGQVDESDTLLGTDSSGGDGWSFVTANTGTAGAATYLARVIDNEDAVGSAASVAVTATQNTGALVAALAASRESATFGQSITLTASGVEASSGSIRNVQFFFDSNGNGVLDTTDSRLATDTSATGGYAANVTIPTTWGTGVKTLFARATDGAGAGSAAALSFTVNPNTMPVATALSTNVSTLPSTNRVTISTVGASDTDGTIRNVEYFADINGNGIYDSGDRRLGASTRAAGGYSLTVTINRAWISNGSVRLFGRLTDNLGGVSNMITTTIAA